MCQVRPAWHRSSYPIIPLPGDLVRPQVPTRHLHSSSQWCSDLEFALLFLLPGAASPQIATKPAPSLGSGLSSPFSTLANRALAFKFSPYKPKYFSITHVCAPISVHLFLCTNLYICLCFIVCLPHLMHGSRGFVISWLFPHH